MDNLRNINLGTGVNRTYNIVTLAFLGLSFLCCFIFFIMLLIPARPKAPRVQPQLLVIPSSTPTEVPTITRTPLPATFTPTFTPTSTETPLPTMTFTTVPSATIAPSATITSTVPATETPTETATPTETQGPPPPSPPPFLFTTQGPPQFVANTFNSAGCAWQGVGGQVLDMNGQPYTNKLKVRVFGGGLPADQVKDTGSNTLYGASGFEIQVANSINTSTYFVQLESEFGTKVSDMIQVAFPGDCSGNVALINFVLVRQP